MIHSFIHTLICWTHIRVYMYIVLSSIVLWMKSFDQYLMSVCIYIYICIMCTTCASRESILLVASCNSEFSLRACPRMHRWRQRQRQRQGQRQRQRQRQREREREKNKDKDTDGGREREREREREIEIEMERETKEEIETDKHSDRHSYRHRLR